MFLPLGDYPNPGTRPWITYSLIAINCAVFVMLAVPLANAPVDLNHPLLSEYLRSVGVRGQVSPQEVLRHVSAYDMVVFQYGYRPADGSILTLFTSMFLHGGFLHLAGNMLFLWIFGDNVEARLGSYRYLLTYLGCGVAATLFFALFVSGSGVPLVGASGAISGVLGCYFLWFPQNQVKTFVFLFPFIMTTLMIPARLVLGVYLVLDNLLPFLLTAGGSGSGVAHGAHIGGFLAGMGVAFAGARQKRSPRPKGARVRQEQTAPRAPSAAGNWQQRLHKQAEYINDLARANRVMEAARAYMRQPEPELRQGLDSKAWLAMAELMLEKEMSYDALRLFRRFIAERPTDPLLARAYIGAGRALLRHPRGGEGAYQYFLGALDVAQDEHTRGQAQAWLRRLAEQNG